MKISSEKITKVILVGLLTFFLAYMIIQHFITQDKFDNLSLKRGLVLQQLLNMNGEQGLLQNLNIVF